MDPRRRGRAGGAKSGIYRGCMAPRSTPRLLHISLLVTPLITPPAADLFILLHPPYYTPPPVVEVDHEPLDYRYVHPTPSHGVGPENAPRPTVDF